MDPQTRAIDRHVEYESETWINAFHVMLPMADCIRQVAQCYANNAAILASGLRRVLHHISVWEFGEINGDIEMMIDDKDNHGYQTQSTPEMHTVELAGHTYQVVKYTVSCQSVSFHNPMHWLLAEMLQFVNLLDDETLKQAGWHSFHNVIFGFYHHPKMSMDQMVNATLQRLQCILDRPIRGK
jgi:E3 ubiquitin-protein ligase UBR1